MRMEEFTPGPWNYTKNVLDTFTIHIGERPNVANQICQADMEGNARLIAAAPDLYEASNVALCAISELADAYVGDMDHDISIAANAELARRKLVDAITKTRSK